jgi:hypothetical protein
MSRFSVRFVALFGMLVAGLFAVTQTSEARPAQPTGACAVESRGATPMCTYLQKCCAGNTENSKKCCEAALKHCGRD